MEPPDVELSPWRIRRNGISLEIPHSLIAAPVAGGLDPPYRMLLHEMGCPLSFTEMVSARAVHHGTERTLRLFEWVPLSGFSGAQIFGADPALLGKAASEMQGRGHHIIDLNLGCPKRKVTKLGAGAAMLKDPANLYRSVRSILDSVSVPVGVKMRSGSNSVDESLLKTISKDLEGLGISYITLHPRTVEQQYSGKADRRLVSRFAEWVDIPVIASGDVKGPVDVNDYLHRGAAGVMVARGILGDPGWMKRCLESLEGGEWNKRYPSTPDAVREHLKTARKHLELAVGWYGRERGTIEFRPHLSWYIKNFKGRAPFRDRLFTAVSPGELLDLMDEMEASWIGSI
ncbi:MAG: tRNA dihydrouridine synthase [Thermoplasmatota archaeon]